MSMTRLDVELARTQAAISKRRRHRVLRSCLAFAILAAALAATLIVVLAYGAGGPAARAGAFMVDDPATGQFLLAGGVVPQGGDPEDWPNLGDVWNWTGRSWKSVSPPLPSDAPNDQDSGWMAYDPSTRRVVLVANQETWTWDGREWQTAQGRAPVLASFVAFDGATNQLVALAGQQSFTTWIWSVKGWQLQRGAAAVPVLPYPVGNVTYDGATRQLLLIGWSGGSSGFTMESWTGHTWVKLHPRVTPPVSLDFDGFAYDGATGQAVLYEDAQRGGVHDIANETWTWDGSDWTEQHPASSPSPRILSSLAYDSTTRQLLLFGGFSDGSPYSDTWDWTGTNWVKMG